MDFTVYLQKETTNFSSRNASVLYHFTFAFFDQSKKFVL
jgi:hypothetical protein